MIKSKKIGVLGGGQLGRMSALAAARLGISTHIFCPEENCPASLVTPFFTKADYTDETALAQFAEQVDVITYEFENIPLQTIEFLQTKKTVYPSAKLLEVSQNRIAEKAFLNEIGILTAPWAPVNAPEDIATTLGKWGMADCIIKTTRFGYDGKGQIFHHENDSVEKSWSALNTNEAIIEGVIDFNYEVSIIIARDLKGQMAVYPPTENDHKNHILDKTHYPSPLTKDLQIEAAAMVRKLAEAVDLVGILTLELFLTKDGKLLANEIAPRTHNSGHWTINACSISQFENHIRCVSGLPVGDPAPHSHATMINLIGNDVNHLDKYLNMPNAHIHLYGKTEARAGRKMGHVTILNNNK